MLLKNNGQKSGGIFSKYIRFSNMVINSNLNSCFHFHLYLPPRFLRFSVFILLLLLNSGPLKSSLSSFSTGSGCTITVPRMISFKKPLHILTYVPKSTLTSELWGSKYLLHKYKDLLQRYQIILMTPKHKNIWAVKKHEKSLRSHLRCSSMQHFEVCSNHLPFLEMFFSYSQRMTVVLGDC